MEEYKKNLSNLYYDVINGTIDLERAKVLLSIIDRMPKD